MNNNNTETSFVPGELYKLKSAYDICLYDSVAKNKVFVGQLNIKDREIIFVYLREAKNIYNNNTKVILYKNRIMYMPCYYLHYEFERIK